jgi:signal transduction histidine kinase
MSSKPSPNNLFKATQRSLAFWHAGIITLILIIPGILIYRLIHHAGWLHLEKEMQALASIVKAQIEPLLTDPGQINDNAQTQMPELCFYPDQCSQYIVLPSQATTSFISKLIYSNRQRDICIQLMDLDNRPVAWLQLPDSPEHCQDPDFWQEINLNKGSYYHQINYPLLTLSRSPWGTLKIAKSIDPLDIFLLRTEIALVAIFLATIGMVSYASWWLARLSMQPVHLSYQHMEQFTADAAHELRSPLSVLRAIVQTALRSESLSPQELQETLQILDRQSQRLSILVQDLLLLSQIEQSAKEFEFRLCCLNEIIENLSNELMSIAVDYDIIFTHHFQVSHAVNIVGDADQLYRAIANLIGNALNYTPAKGRVTVILDMGSTHAIIHVKDTGIGISPEEQERIFDRFYRINQTRSFRQGGSGLGLAIAQAIAHRHHGSLTVESRLGQGSIFTLRLPLAKD